MTEVWTIGHGTCPQETFVGLVRREGIALVADVRSHPGSRTNPQFAQDTMRGWLDSAGIGYVHLPELGGHRHKQDIEPGINSGWRHRSFKNYADYTLTPGYEQGIKRLAGLASQQRVAYLCAESMPWRCHRLLISNTLTARGWTVRHIMGGPTAQVHEFGRWGATPSVHEDGTITYPSDA